MRFSLFTLLAAVETVTAAPGWADWQKSLYTTSTTTSIQSTPQPSTWSSATFVPPFIKNNTTSVPTTTAYRHDWGSWTNKTTTRSHTQKATDIVQGAWTNWPAEGGSVDSNGRPSASYTPSEAQYISSDGESASSGQYYSNNVVDNAGWDAWYDQPPLFSVDAPAATLVPITHWDTDRTDTKNLIPSKQNSMYYATDGESSAYTTHRMAWVHANFTSEAVLLDNSVFLSYNYSPSSQTLIVTFSVKAAYEIAAATWGRSVLFVTNDGKCGADEACFLRVVSLTFDEKRLVCTLSVTPVDFQSAVNYFDYEWGLHRPAKPSPSISTSTDGRSQSTTQTHGSSSSSTTTKYPETASGVITQSSPTATSTNSSGVINYEVDNVDESNCTAPADIKTGLPAACFGENFDEDIDEKYGYQSITDPAFGNFASQFNDLFSSDPPQPDAEDEAMYAMDEAALGLNEDMDLDFSKRHAKRLIGRLLPKKWRKALAKLIPIKGVTTPLKFEKRLVKLNMVAPKQRKTQKSPWGQQVLIKSATRTSKKNAQNQGKIEIFCVDCGVQGRAEIFGRAGVSVLNGLETLGVRLEFNMALTLKVGIDAQVVYSETFTQNLFTVPLSKTCVKPVICAGPVIKVGTDLILTAKAHGQLLAGATVAINNAKADLELIPPKVKASGWTPEFRPVFEASGSIDLTADFGLPLALALELDVLNGKFKRDVALVNRPALVANAAVAASASLDSGKVVGGVEATNGCNGIATSLHLKNDIYVKLPNDKRINVFNSPQKKLDSKCIALRKTQDIVAGDQSKLPTTGQNAGATTDSTTSNNVTPNTNTDTTSNAATTPEQQQSTSTTGSTGGTAGADAAEEGASTNGSDNGDSEAGIAPISRFRRRTGRVVAREDIGSGTTTTIQNTTPTPDPQSSQGTQSDAKTSTDTVTTTTTASDDSEILDTTVQDRATGTEITTDFETPKHGDQAYNMTNGYSIVTLTDTLANYQLHSCADGNLHLFAISDTIPDYECGSGFTMVTADGTIMADAMARVPIYYPDEMEQLGFSRFRIVDDRSIPKGSKEIVLIPDETEMETGDKATLYYPMTPDSGDGITFYPIVCKYVDEQPDKLFLAADAENAITALLNPDLRATLTGGEIAECWNMPMIRGAGSKAAGESDWLSNNPPQDTLVPATTPPSTAATGSDASQTTDGETVPTTT